MAKEMRGFRSWIEVAPAPIIYPHKPSNSPRLETITEEGLGIRRSISKSLPTTQGSTTNAVRSCRQVEALFPTYLYSAMAKEIKDLRSWIEVTPALFISLRKTSSSPSLETITEEEAEDREDDK
ncbi:unnamed protein product [Dovyalis caffra]|uniref:Uncharacterized protein n=1 Tax=Dovyalis caffra TaxID=77055 RepID=A0AAV1S2A9_9ROSI|nr:unnamed protein product [Dovyalis caffra]